MLVWAVVALAALVGFALVAHTLYLDARERATDVPEPPAEHVPDAPGPATGHVADAPQPAPGEEAGPVS